MREASPLILFSNFTNIRTHIHTGYTHRGTHTQKRKQERGGKKKIKKSKSEGDRVLMGVEERGY